MLSPWTPDYEDYLRDESRVKGCADSISFPVSEDEIKQTLVALSRDQICVTIQGARTGIVAGAVPRGGHILNLSRMNGIGDIVRDEYCTSLKVQPGATLQDIRAVVEKENLFFPPDPTETSASIGGMAACNASGAISFRYGSTRQWIRAIRVLMADGGWVYIRRCENFADGRRFWIADHSGRVYSGTLPILNCPDIKSAAGYHIRDNMDIIDLFIGSEGTLGIITEIELKLIPKPAAVAGLTAFLPHQDAALELVRRLRREKAGGLNSDHARPVAIEFFNSDALDLLRDAKSADTAFSSIPALKPHYHTAVYLEFHCSSRSEAEEAAMESLEAVTALGGSDDDTWFADAPREMEQIKAFRHAVPEAVNLAIDKRKRTCPELTKLGTDMSVPDDKLEEVFAMYDGDLGESGLESVIFGHIGNNHVHVNILPRDMDEYRLGRELYLAWAGKVVGMGGSVSAEHGIGKLKAPLLKLMYGEDGIKEMRALKQIFDPQLMLNPGNLIAD